MLLIEIRIFQALVSLTTERIKRGEGGGGKNSLYLGFFVYIVGVHILFENKP
jgi:hypothetical protein